MRHDYNDRAILHSCRVYVSPQIAIYFVSIVAYILYGLGVTYATGLPCFSTKSVLSGKLFLARFILHSSPIAYKYSFRALPTVAYSDGLCWLCKAKGPHARGLGPTQGCIDLRNFFNNLNHLPSSRLICLTIY